MLCTIHISPGIIKQLNIIIRQCLWRDKLDTPKQSLAAWDMICKPKLKGGLGIVDFQKKNDALLVLHKFYNSKRAIPCVKLIWSTYCEFDVPHAAKLCGSYWWRDVATLMDKYRSVVRPEVKSGETVLFWTDEWNFDGSGNSLSERPPRLFSVRDMSLLLDRSDEFHRSLSAQAYEEFCFIQDKLDQLQLVPIGHDEWKCAKGAYKAHHYYLSLYDHI
jgi:hypothetical protein